MGIEDKYEKIIIKRKKKDRRMLGEREEYEENERKSKLRSEMEKIKGWIGKEDIEVLEDYEIDVDDKGEDIIRLREKEKRKLRSYLKERENKLKQGGSMLGGLWKKMKKEERREILMIKGEY